LRDWRRINVSFTRAKKKLVIFGSRSTLLSDRLLADFFSLVEEQQWVRRLPRGADQMHGEVKSDTLSDDKESKAVKEELGEGKSKDKGKRAVLGERLVNAHPFVKEILEVSLSR
jgi:DNA replication ATP-dependent helicase Dna2